MTPSRDLLISQYYGKLSLRDIAKKFGININTVVKTVKRLGLKNPNSHLQTSRKISRYKINLDPLINLTDIGAFYLGILLIKARIKTNHHGTKSVHLRFSEPNKALYEAMLADLGSNHPIKEQKLSAAQLAKVAKFQSHRTYTITISNQELVHLLENHHSAVELPKIYFINNLLCGLFEAGATFSISSSKNLLIKFNKLGSKISTTLNFLNIKHNLQEDKVTITGKAAYSFCELIYADPVRCNALRYQKWIEYKS